ncbi:MAG: tRNA (guanosine(46)-N7)-methyltransferase TrmB [Firmicutes bacterium]|nr:tRNA (guanosine(46)-N7)-methyltransferase TrmB [Bacillota bacterium]
MRLRNIKGAQDIIAKSKYIVLEPEKYKGNFKKIFNNSNPIEIEIGMGKGDFIIEKAKQNPNINYVGVEKYASVLVYATKKLEDYDLPNLKIINIDANTIDETFSKEISKVYLNFSDPWPKKKHSNRRLTSFIFLNKYKNIFINDSYIEMKTDNANLFEYSIVSLSEFGYVLKYVSFDLYNDDLTGNVQTEYEKKFVSKGMNIHKLIAVQKVDY